MFRRLIKLSGLLALAVAIVWLTREHLLPTPHLPHEPPPHYRSTPPPPASQPDDLTAIKGIGPVYATRLGSIGISTFHQLAEADSRTVADTLSLPFEAVSDWISQAADRTS